MRSIFVFIFSVFFLTSLSALQPDTLVRAIRIGVNISHYGYFAVEGGFLRNEITIDYTWKPKNFLVMDFGIISGGIKTENYSLNANGFFSRFGIDHNFLPHPEDVLSVGARMGFSSYRYRPSNIALFDPVWGDFEGFIEPQQMSALWVEAVFGIKSEFFSNFFMGWYLSARVMLLNTQSEIFADYKVPGFGSLKGSVSPGFGFYVFYRFPFNNKFTGNN